MTAGIYIYIYIYIYIHLTCAIKQKLTGPVGLLEFGVFSNFPVAKRYRVAKTHTMPYLHRTFFAKEPYN